MFADLIAILDALNKLTPLAVIGLLGVVIFVLVYKKGPLQLLKNNHMVHVQDSLDRIAESSDKQVDLLHTIKEDMSYVKGKLDQ